VSSPSEDSGRLHADAPERGDDLADRVERVRTPRTPAFALTGVWIVVAAAFVIVLALVVLAVYLV
jgi:hypothetical protein